MKHTAPPNASAASDASVHVLGLEEDPRPPELARSFLVWWHPLVARAAIVSLYLYTFVRVYCLVTSNGCTLLMWVFLLAEWGVANPSVTAQWLTIAAGAATSRRPRRPLLRLQGSELPTVDMLIVCCGEKLEIIMDTVRAACVLEYSRSCFRVLVLDDGDSSQVREAVEDLRTSYPHLHYSARGKSPDFVFSKAGNINHALHQVHNVQWPAPEFVAVLDADFIAEPHFLRATVPHLILNPKIAMVSTPQHFYNLPAGDPLLQALDYGTNVLEPLQDRRGTATCSGSGFVLRRSSVVPFGGFPIASFNEDVLLSLLLAQANWDIAHLQEPLQFGMVPNSLEGHIAQRKRWSIGVSQLMNVLRPSVDLPINFSERIDFAQEGFLFFCHLVWCTFSLLLMSVALFWDSSLVAYSSIGQLKLLSTLAIIYHATTWTHEWFIAASSRYSVSVFPHLNQVWMAPLQVPAVLRFALYQIIGKRHSVMPTPTGSQESFETTTSSHRSQRQSLWKVFWDCGTILHLGLFFLTLTSMAYSAHQIYTFSSHPPRILPRSWLTRLGWPPVLNLCYIVITQTWVPIAEAIWPTPRPRRASILVPDAASFAVYPSPQARATALKRIKPPMGRFHHYILVPVMLFLATIATLSL